VDLWQANLVLDISKVEGETIFDQINKTGSDGCSDIQKLCQLGPCCTSMCSPCSINNVASFGNATLYDNTTTQTLLYCPLLCTNGTLKNISSSADQNINNLNYWINLDSLIRNTTEPLLDTQFRDYVKGIACDVTNPVGYTYTGIGLVLGGLLLDVIICLILRGGSYNKD